MNRLATVSKHHLSRTTCLRVWLSFCVCVCNLRRLSTVSVAASPLSERRRLDCSLLRPDSADGGCPLWLAGLGNVAQPDRPTYCAGYPGHWFSWGRLRRETRLLRLWVVCAWAAARDAQSLIWKLPGFLLATPNFEIHSASPD